MESKFETLKEIDDYESKNVLTDEERRALFERRMQISFRIRDWREENGKLGLEPTISDNWTPQQRESFLRDWFGDSPIIEACRCEERRYDEEPFEQVNEGASTSQGGRGEKRMHDDDDEDERPYAIENVKEVNIKKFRTKGTNYTLRFNNVMADVEIKDVHERLHDVFQNILDNTIGNVPSRDKLRMLIHSTQLEYPIAFPFTSSKQSGGKFKFKLAQKWKGHEEKKRDIKENTGKELRKQLKEMKLFLHLPLKRLPG